MEAITAKMTSENAERSEKHVPNNKNYCLWQTMINGGVSIQTFYSSIPMGAAIFAQDRQHPPLSAF